MSENETVKHLDYFRDKDNNYIIRRTINTQDTNQSYFSYSGAFNSIYIIKKENMEEDVEKIFEKLSNDIEGSVKKQYKINMDSILFEKITGNFVEEDEYNPLFSHMTEEEILAFKGSSTKVRITIAFEFNIKLEKHLKFKAFKDMLLGKFKNHT